MAEVLKTPMSSVTDDIISMEFDENPNIPTANYSEETADRIKSSMKTKMRADKLRKMIDAELKDTAKNKKSSDGESLGIPLSFSSM